jgi:hypothetical protein
VKINQTTGELAFSNVQGTDVFKDEVQLTGVVRTRTMRNCQLQLQDEALGHLKKGGCQFEVCTPAPPGTSGTSITPPSRAGHRARKDHPRLRRRGARRAAADRREGAGVSRAAWGPRGEERDIEQMASDNASGRAPLPLAPAPTANTDGITTRPATRAGPKRQVGAGGV